MKKGIIFRKRNIIAAIALMVLLFLGYSSIFGNKTKTTYTVAKAEKGKIVQTVSETGTVKADSEINLSFLNNGKLKVKYARGGDEVKKGDLIAELDKEDLEIKKEEASANFEVAEEDLKKLVSGATTEEVAIYRANLAQAKSSYDSALSELGRTKTVVAENIMQDEKALNDLIMSTAADITSYEQAVTVAETSLQNTKKTYSQEIDNYKNDAVVKIGDKIAAANTALDTIDRTINDADGEDYISVKNESYLSTTLIAYNSAKKLLDTARIDLKTAELYKSDSSIKQAVASTLSVLNKTFTSLQNCYSALENSVTTTSFIQSELDTLKTNISTQQTAIATAISAVQTASQNLDDATLNYSIKVSEAEEALKKAQVALDDAKITAENNLSTSRAQGQQQITVAESKASAAYESWQVSGAQLNKILASASRYDISLAQARIKQARAAVDSLNKQIENSAIIAPIDGVITKDNFKEGEQISMGAVVFAMLGENDFEIEVLVSEADISKISLDDKAKITLDSFGEDTEFYGKVYFVDPAETELQDVIYYKIKIEFDQEDKDVKSGMTANITIITDMKENALIIPNRAIIDKNGQGKFARVLENGQLVEKQVTIGINGDDGLMEILSGLNEGEDVVTYVKTE
ncbi:MAG: efflux RND transporter periplasmic adaptor subunit [bacterium]